MQPKKWLEVGCNSHIQNVTHLGPFLILGNISFPGIFPVSSSWPLTSKRFTEIKGIDLWQSGIHYLTITYTKAWASTWLMHLATWLRLPEIMGCLSDWRIFPIKSHSRKRWSTMIVFLLSKHDNIMLSTWWCKELLYGYLHEFKPNKFLEIDHI